MRGSTLVAILVLLFAILSLTMSALISARSELKISSNYESGIQALLAAEAGVVHSQTVIDRYGVTRFDSDVVAAWDTLFGESSRSLPGRTSAQYSVTTADDPTNPAEFMLLTAVGQAPNQSQRSIRVRLQRGDPFSPGAIYLPNSAVSTHFNGNAFLIDGNDRNLDGTPSGNLPVPGIGTATTQSADAVRTSLSAQQADNVVGAAGVPSVDMSPGPSIDRVQGEMTANLLSQPGVVTNPALSGNDTFGTVASPRITHFTGNVTINGRMSGAGILIVDQGLTISGTADFTGLIIVRGATQITTVSGSATVLGALWTTDLTLNVSGTASVTYSSEALTLANGVDPSESLLPRRVRAVAWTEL